MTNAKIPDARFDRQDAHADLDKNVRDAAPNVQLTDAELQRLRQTFESVPFARLLGLELGALERGSATIHLQLRDELLRNGGIAHGGVIASLADTAAAFAVNTLLEPDQHTVTIDLTLQYLRPLTTGRITAQAQVLRAGRRIANVQVNVHDEAGTLTATMLTTYLKT